jgi:hypothetical protein
MMIPVKHGMSHWYDPISLARIAIRVAVSSVFGAFADRRELVAAVNPVANDPFDSTHDYSDNCNDAGDFWFDFVADTGDGWAATRAVAQLASCDSLAPVGHDGALARGRLLVMGGDQVYPTASHQAYQERLVGPWNSACKEIARAPGLEADPADLGDLYAIPGNHDWYDGLIAFSHLFARRTYASAHLASTVRTGKIIARRQTRQVRSYFALKLPHGWWMWGTDSQLEGFIDQPQVDFFRYVAQHWMEPGSKLILCVGQPSWAYVDPAAPHQAFNNFAFLSRLAADARSPTGKPMGHKLRLVLTGDAHHYARYVEEDVHYVTAGGGGAFLHPTHHLRDHIAFEWEAPPPTEAWDDKRESYPRHYALARNGGAMGPEAVYPSRRDSFVQSLKTLAFPFYNPMFVVLYACFYGLLLWAMDARVASHKAGEMLGRFQKLDGDYAAALGSITDIMVHTPIVVVLLLGTWAIYVYFADWADSRWRRAVAGSLHAVGHIALFMAIAAALLPAYGQWVGDRAATLSSSGPVEAATQPSDAMQPVKPTQSANRQMSPTADHGAAAGGWHAVVSGVLVALSCALASAFWFGLYLFGSLSLFRRHWNEALSASRIRHFKNMLRMKIDAHGLTLYPVGLRHVPGQDVPARDLGSELIEPPVRIV